MFDIAPSELLLVAVVALVVIGPKDLPKALRVLGYWVGRARGVARQFRAGFDEMVREAELAEMEKKWASENERIMKEHGAGTPADVDGAAAAGEAASAPTSDDVTSSPNVTAAAIADDAPPQPGRTDRSATLAKSRARRGGPAAGDAPVIVEQPQVAPAPAGADVPPADPAAS